MARIFKHQYSGGRLSKKFYAEFKDHTGRMVRRACSTDRRVAEQMAAEWEREEERIKCGLIPRQAPELKRHIVEHLDEYQSHLIATGVTLKHANQVRSRLAAVVAGCKWTCLADLQPASAIEWLSRQTTGPATSPRPMSNRTVSHFLTHLTAFGAWCVPSRLPANPFAGVEKPQASADRRHLRRVIKPEDFRRLINATRVNRTYWGLSGEDRAALYMTAAYSGMRASECGELRREDFDLGKSPSLKLDGRFTKNGEAAVIPLPEWVADELRPWIIKQSGILWSGIWAKQSHAAKLLRYDLKVAGIPYKDERGRVFDFHSLRCYFAVELLLSNVPLVVVQKLMRHCSADLTTNVYAQLGLEDIATEVAKVRRAG